MSKISSASLESYSYFAGNKNDIALNALRAKGIDDLPKLIDVVEAFRASNSLKDQSGHIVTEVMVKRFLNGEPYTIMTAFFNAVRDGSDSVPEVSAERAEPDESSVGGSRLLAMPFFTTPLVDAVAEILSRDDVEEFAGYLQRSGVSGVDALVGGVIAQLKGNEGTVRSRIYALLRGEDNILAKRGAEHIAALIKLARDGVGWLAENYAPQVDLTNGERPVGAPRGHEVGGIQP